MNFKKLLTVLLALSLIMTSAINVMAEGSVSKNVTFTVECSNETRNVKIEGTKIAQPEGTIVTLFVWNPGYDSGDLATAAFSEACCYGNEAVVGADGTASFHFTLDAAAFSGVYNFTVYVPGMVKPYKSTFTYENIYRSSEVVAVLQDETKGLGEVLSIFEYGISDVNASAGFTYRGYDDDKKEYVANYVISNRPIADKDDLKTKIQTVVDALEAVKTASAGDRTVVAKLVESKENPMLLSQKALAAYNALTPGQKENAIANYIHLDAKDWVYPEDASKSVIDAAGKVEDPSDEVVNSSPIVSTDKKDEISVGIDSDIVKDNAQKDTEEEFAGDVKPAFFDLASVPWAQSAITILAERGIVNGKGSGVFAPSDLITREEFVKLIVTAFDIRLGSQKILPFVDVDSTAWYSDPVIIAFNNGIVKGVSDTEFGVGAPITRQDMITMLHSVVNFAGYSVGGDNAVAYRDTEAIAYYAKTPVEMFTKAGLISGRGEGMFVPQGTATRAEAATVIYRLLYSLKLI